MQLSKLINIDCHFGFGDLCSGEEPPAGSIQRPAADLNYRIRLNKCAGDTKVAKGCKCAFRRQSVASMMILGIDGCATCAFRPFFRRFVGATNIFMWPSPEDKWPAERRHVCSAFQQIASFLAI